MLDQNAFGATLFRFVPQEHGLFFFSGSNLCAGQISLLVSSWLIHLQDPWISSSGRISGRSSLPQSLCHGLLAPLFLHL